jgi:sec-independent protein translocase protein TatB
MEILGIGPGELFFIILIALIVLGPKDMQKAGHTVGKWLRELTTSDGWKVFQRTSREIRAMPARLMREAQFDELDRELQGTLDPRHAPGGGPRTAPPEESGQGAPGGGGQAPAERDLPPGEDDGPDA